MSGCENSNGSCATRIAFRASCSRPKCMGCLVIRWSEWCIYTGAEKNGVRSVWLFVPQFLRSTTVGGPRSFLWTDADLSGAGDAPSGLPEVRRSEARTFGLAGRQSVLHQAVCLLRGATMPRFDDQGGGRRTALGLENGQGAGQAVYVRAGAPDGLSSAVGHRHRRNLDPQRAHLPDRGERFAAPAAHLVRRQGPFRSQLGGVVCLAGCEEMWPDSSGRDGHVEAVPARDRSPRFGGRNPVRQITQYAAFGRGSGSRPQERIRPIDGLQTAFYQGPEIHPLVQPGESGFEGPSCSQRTAARQPAPACGLSAQGVLRTTLELRAGRLGLAVLRELEGRAQVAATQTLRAVRPHDPGTLGWHCGLLPTGNQSLAGVRRRTQYLLSKLSASGTNGQFRTPRHIIAMMVALVNPRPGQRICDPACGTAGFL